MPERGDGGMGVQAVTVLDGESANFAVGRKTAVFSMAPDERGVGVAPAVRGPYGL